MGVEDLVAETPLTATGLGLEELAHDLRQELAVLRHLVDRLHLPLVAADRAALLDGTREQVDALDRLVLSVTEPSPVRVLVDLARVAADVVSAVRPGHGGELLLTTRPAPPVLADEVLLRRALLNVVVNATASAPGGTVGVDVRPAGGEVLVTVTDAGPGGRDPAQDALGLGQWVVHAVLRDCGGTVERVRASGGGRRVVLRLPEAP